MILMASWTLLLAKKRCLPNHVFKSWNIRKSLEMLGADFTVDGRKHPRWTLSGLLWRWNDIALVFIFGWLCRDNIKCHNKFPLLMMFPAVWSQPTLPFSPSYCPRHTFNKDYSSDLQRHPPSSWRSIHPSLNILHHSCIPPPHKSCSFSDGFKHQYDFLFP